MFELELVAPPEGAAQTERAAVQEVPYLGLVAGALPDELRGSRAAPSCPAPMLAEITSTRVGSPGRTGERRPRRLGTAGQLSVAPVPGTWQGLPAPSRAWTARLDGPARQLGADGGAGAGRGRRRVRCQPHDQAVILLRVKRSDRFRVKSATPAFVAPFAEPARSRPGVAFGGRMSRREGVKDRWTDRRDDALEKLSPTTYDSQRSVHRSGRSGTGVRGDILQTRIGSFWSSRVHAAAG